MVVLLLTTAEKTRESPSAPPETELVTRLAPVEKTKVSAPAPPKDGCARCSNREGEGVAVSTEVNGAVGDSTLEDHAVTTSATVKTWQQKCAGEQRRSDPASPLTIAPLLTPAEKFRVSLSAPPAMVPPERHHRRKQSPYRRRHQSWKQSSDSEEVTTKVSLPAPPAMVELVAPTVREKSSLPAPKSMVAP